MQDWTIIDLGDHNISELAMKSITPIKDYGLHNITQFNSEDGALVLSDWVLDYCNRDFIMRQQETVLN